jgi:hypothetical protein
MKRATFLGWLVFAACLFAAYVKAATHYVMATL